ncbi:MULTISPECIES: hypothetical protein [Streptomyces]|uniref:Uncharacterized protein n=2 Tax=Streptomyces TaxID=1883 RepID=A0ABN4DWW4_STRLI|nr:MULTISPECIES: hypothetical protein [Streptomyces]QSJ11437.1 hypothetical protein SLIVDG2_24710 [Streptomyces lividans]AIJ15859.1 hypothetical protein SLIV_24710 [Streptomyces lividans TK24]MBQ0947784.1 hypothetical protein [Streptomyces sp. RK76]MDX3322590.1 hypothetical protein [Streptomyces sp. ME03-5684b]MDX3350041.1 hypothetical protein [Streptomyces sp. ME02-6979A]
MKQLPTPHQVMRKGYAAVRSARSRLDSLVLVPPSPDDWPRVAADHLSLLDGRTLNVCVTVPDDLTAASASLVLGGGSSPVVIPLTLVQRGDGRVEARGTSVVDLLENVRADSPPVPAGMRRFLLEAGQWRLSVVFTDVRGQERRFALAAAPRLMPDGPTLPEPVRADGTYCRVIASSTGRAYLSLGRDHAEAEIVSVDIGWSQITLRGRLVNSPAEACSGDVELIRRNGKVSRTLPATWQGDVFTCTVHTADFGASGTKEQIWDVRLRRPRGRSLKLCRRRTDVRSPGDVFRMPNRLLTADDGTALRINPYYTPVGSLAFRAALIPSGS